MVVVVLLFIPRDFIDISGEKNDARTQKRLPGGDQVGAGRYLQRSRCMQSYNRRLFPNTAWPNGGSPGQLAATLGGSEVDDQGWPKVFGDYLLENDDRHTC